MDPKEQQELIEQMRKRAISEQNTLYSRTGAVIYAREDYPPAASRGAQHFFLFLFSLLVLFFAVDYLDSSHDYVAVISDAVTSNPALTEAYEKVENSDFINWLTELFR